MSWEGARSLFAVGGSLTAAGILCIVAAFFWSWYCEKSGKDPAKLDLALLVTAAFALLIGVAIFFSCHPVKVIRVLSRTAVKELLAGVLLLAAAAGMVVAAIIRTRRTLSAGMSVLFLCLACLPLVFGSVVLTDSRHGRAVGAPTQAWNPAGSQESSGNDFSPSPSLDYGSSGSGGVDYGSSGSGSVGYGGSGSGSLDYGSSGSGSLGYGGSGSVVDEETAQGSGNADFASAQSSAGTDSGAWDAETTDSGSWDSTSSDSGSWDSGSSDSSDSGGSDSGGDGGGGGDD
jgi:hypothetical protein